MNKGQIFSALGNLEEAMRLWHEAQKQLEANGIQLCGFNPGHDGSDAIHVYCGIDDLAVIVGEELTIDEGTANKDKLFMYGNVKYFQIAVNGAYRERKVVDNDLSDC